MTTDAWTPLHQAALDEAQGGDVASAVARLLQDGADVHAADSKGDTPFNVAAPASPVAGRLMTLHWLESALQGKGGRGLNDLSGSHGSTLAQYMAKWLHDDEIGQRFSAGVAAGLRIDVPNKSGWTPLSAAAAMGRVAAVGALLPHYAPSALFSRTTEDYRADYGSGRIVEYPAGVTAAEIAYARLVQDKAAPEPLRHALSKCICLILLRGSAV